MGVRHAQTGLLSERLAAYVAGLRVPQGSAVGEPIRVLPWQHRVLKLFDSDGDVAASIARRNGKTVLAAAIAAAAIDGPLAAPGAENIVAASSFAQATLLFRMTLRLMGDKLKDRGRYRVLDSQNKASIEDRESGTRLLVIGNVPQRAHGMAVKVSVCDELAQWDVSKRDPMLAALRTSAGTIPGSRMFCIGTRPSDSGHPFQRMLDGPRGVSFAPDPESDPFDPATWLAANPSMAEPEFAELAAVIAREAKEAARDPLALQAFRALRLNGGTSDSIQAQLLDAADWQRIEASAPDMPGPYVLGIDLGTSAAMSAASAFFLETGALDGVAVFPELPSLAVRGLGDGVGNLYADCAATGDLIQAGSRVADVNALLAEARNRWGDPVAIVTDRWREADLRQALEAVGFPMARLVLRGQGYKDGGEDVRTFRAACLAGKVVPRRSLLMRSAMREARVVCDPAGNAKLAKSTEGGRRRAARDDVAAAAILAVSQGVRMGAQSVAPRRRWAVAR